MERDPIVAEIRAVRQRLAARFGYDVRAIALDAERRDAAGDREVVRRPRRPVAMAQSAPTSEPHNG